MLKNFELLFWRRGDIKIIGFFKIENLFEEILVFIIVVLENFFNDDVEIV